MRRKRITAQQVLEAMKERCKTEDPERLLQFACRTYADRSNQAIIQDEQYTQLLGIFDTVVACLVKQLGGEARIPREDIEDPPDLIEDDDPVDGVWIFRTSS